MKRAVLVTAVVAAGAAGLARQLRFEQRLIAALLERDDEITRAFEEIGRGFKERDRAFAKLVRELEGRRG